MAEIGCASVIRTYHSTPTVIPIEKRVLAVHITATNLGVNCHHDSRGMGNDVACIAFGGRQLERHYPA